MKNTKGKSVKVRETIHEELYRVFPEIRYVFDRHGVKIAERRKPGEPLYSTGRGYFRNIEQKNKKTGEEKKNGKN
ncbi:hypothetical protein RV18_GL000606 [Enterococcus termitis]|nr:hypothetical protein RV18_GL000606 [Enterococcus termitis]